jgi:hypothetical protein
MTNKNTIAEAVTNAVVVALQQVLPTILATTENKPSEKAKVTTKVVTPKVEKKETIKKAKTTTAKAPTMPEERPTEKQQAYYVSLCDKFGLEPKADLTKKSISLEIGLLKKHGKKASGYVAKGNKPIKSKKTSEAKASVNSYVDHVHNLLKQVCEAQKSKDYATMLHNLVAVADAHAKASQFAKAKNTLKTILDGKLTSITPLTEDDKVIFNNTLSAITLSELTM